MADADRESALAMTGLEQAIASAAPEALLVDSRILRRVIRLDRRLKGLGIRVPHDQSYTIDRDRLLAFVDYRELPAGSELAPMVILLGRPSEQELEQWVTSKLLVHYWRLIFHSRLHAAVTSRYRSLEERLILVEKRRSQLGQLVFEEFRSVLLKDGWLFQEHTAWEVYVEFLAVALELKYFAPECLPCFFPAIGNWEVVEELLSLDSNHLDIYNATRLIGTDQERSVAIISASTSLRTRLERIGKRWTLGSNRDHERWQQAAARFESVGNHVKAAMHWNFAAQCTAGKRASHFRELSLKEMKLLIEKLQQALRLEDTRTDQWLNCLSPALDVATGQPWSPEARLLYDLQKICVEDESESRRANLLGWVKSFGHQPATRSLPLLKFVLRTKYVKSARRRLFKSQLRESDRQRIAELLALADERAESQLRDAIRPLIHHQLDGVGLVPENVPERVACNKLVEELLDHLVEYGYMTSGTLRDALSKGDLKLRDVSGQELLFGDQLLLADRHLARALDGVYRPAPVYLRWSQRLSSLAFGTQLGRFLTLHTALPFGGAFLLVEGVRHVIAWFAGDSSNHRAPDSESVDPSVAEVKFSDQYAGGESGVLYIVAWVLLSGLLIYMLMHRPKFRATCARYGNLLLIWSKSLLLDWPAKLLRIRLIEQLLYSPTFAPLRTYLIKPGLLTAAILFALQLFFPGVDLRNALVIFLVLALVLNSPIGRYADEWFADQVLQTVEELRARVFGALFQWIMDAFQQLLVGLDRLLHTLDEWSRFRSRDNQWVKVGKFITGTLWSIIAYFVVLVSTLLIEPQINPIKHFPVVTVSHKLLLPFGPLFVVWLSPFIGATQANTLVWSTIWLIPGVFGFLVWELRGNWRLYAANRSMTLQPQSVGSHGETMLALLRPSFHSGTLPKLFTRLRRAMRKTQETGNPKQLARQQTALNATLHQIRRFVERELIELLVQSNTLSRDTMSVDTVRLATNSIRVALRSSSAPNSQFWISWEDSNNRLEAKIDDPGLIPTLSSDQQKNFATALAGLLKRTGAEQIDASPVSEFDQPLTWNQWVALWRLA